MRVIFFVRNAVHCSLIALLHNGFYKRDMSF